MPIDSITGLNDEQKEYLLKHPPYGPGADPRAQVLASSAVGNVLSFLVGTKEGRTASGFVIGCLAMVAIPFAVVSYNQCMSMVNSITCRDGSNIMTDVNCDPYQCSQGLATSLIWRSFLFLGCCIFGCLSACQSDKSSESSDGGA